MAAWSWCCASLIAWKLGQPWFFWVGGSITQKATIAPWKVTELWNETGSFISPKDSASSFSPLPSCHAHLSRSFPRATWSTWHRGFRVGLHWPCSAPKKRSWPRSACHTARCPVMPVANVGMWDGDVWIKGIIYQLKHLVIFDHWRCMGTRTHLCVLYLYIMYNIYKSIIIICVYTYVYIHMDIWTYIPMSVTTWPRFLPKRMI